MYEENKPSTLINDVQEWRNFFRAILVRSAMPNNRYIWLLYEIQNTNEKKKTYEGNNIFIFGTADLTGIARKKLGRSWSSLIKVEGLFSPYIVTHR